MLPRVSDHDLLRRNNDSEKATILARDVLPRMIRPPGVIRA